VPEAERFQGANAVDAGRLSPYWGEHAARYVYALPFVEGKTVLDIACGTGYGIGLIQTKATFVAGVDVDTEAALEAVNECAKNAAVILGNGLDLPFPGESFDLITSFETLEHLHERSAFLKELQRVLRPNGLLLLSTPNARYTHPVDGKPSNPFHVHEYTPDELGDELKAFFSVDQLLGQTLDASVRISPFYAEQQRLSKDLKTQTQLLAWKVFNKIPLAVRERLSHAIWRKPFYPTEMDYNFDEHTAGDAPTLLAVCRKA
jgi:ubiquinone/menaquinone biosynthesis C-methylase UbiE